MEFVDLYDENRFPLGRTAPRFSRREKGTWRLITHLCIFDSRGRLLIQQRSSSKRIWPGKWDVSAAGGVSSGETTRSAAVRELEEELGISAPAQDLRSVCTVTFNYAFDDYFILKRAVDLTSIRRRKKYPPSAGPPASRCWISSGETLSFPIRKIFWLIFSTWPVPWISRISDLFRPVFIPFP